MSSLGVTSDWSELVLKYDESWGRGGGGRAGGGRAGGVGEFSKCAGILRLTENFQTQVIAQ